MERSAESTFEVKQFIPGGGRNTRDSIKGLDNSMRHSHLFNKTTWPDDPLNCKNYLIADSWPKPSPATMFKPASFSFVLFFLLWVWFIEFRKPFLIRCLSVLLWSEKIETSHDSEPEERARTRIVSKFLLNWGSPVADITEKIAHFCCCVWKWTKFFTVWSNWGKFPNDIL